MAYHPLKDNALPGGSATPGALDANHQAKTYSHDEWDEMVRPAPNEVGFDEVLNKAISRRDFFKGSALLFSSSVFFKSTPSQAKAALPSTQAAQFNGFDFTPVQANTNDTITLPEGFHWSTVIGWGDPLWSHSPPFKTAEDVSAQSQSMAFGDNNDGMNLFEINGKTLLAINNEYVNFASFFSHRASGGPETHEDRLKTQQAVGVSIIEVNKDQNGWTLVKDSPYNRRITARTPMEITGPARGHAHLKTPQDPSGTQSLGTWANCGSGKTPWGTYLTCEENFNGFYASTQSNLPLSPEWQRYGMAASGYGYDWHLVEDRFDLAKSPNEPNRSGYVVEIDPANPNLPPKKRTALGRFKHENAEMVVSDSGQIVVYLGDDERGEYLYRYVSTHPYTQTADVDDLMDNGTLYAAKFNDDGTGNWLELTPETCAMSKAKICIYTRMAASEVGATTMDRPEWVAVNPNKPEVFCALTNNKHRGLQTNAGGDYQPVNGPNPRANNLFGQIIRWEPTNEDHAADTFNWNVFVLAGNPTVYKNSLYAGTSNIHSGNLFNSPDGIHFDSQGRLWIQTDGKTSNQDEFAGMGNNQMLLANPNTGEIKRFMVGPNGCEITGFAYSPDRQTVFVGIQHPGESQPSRFPDGKTARSCVIAIWHKNEQPIA